MLTGLTGAFGNNLLAFCFVPVFYFAHHHATTPSRWPRALGWPRTAAELALLLLLVAFGFALLALSTTSTITTMLSGSS